MLKVGDRYICIKDRITRHLDDNIIHKSGNVYYILNISGYYNIVEFSSDNTSGYIYSINDNESYYYLNEYFKPLKEYRKQKLNKIEENDIIKTR